jgi:hypothetical protein
VGQALRLTAQYFRQTQRDDGSWTYVRHLALSRHSMTCAGLFCLAAEQGASPGYVRNIRPGERTEMPDPAITRGFQFLTKACDTIANGGAIDSAGRLYFLWSLERVAVIYGVETIGSRPWYPWAAELLLRTQQDDGSWPDEGPRPVSTCFALLILRRSNLTPGLLVRAPDLTQPREPIGAPGQPGVRDYPARAGPAIPQGPAPPRATIPAPEQRTKPGAARPAEPPVSQVPVDGPKQTLTLNIHLRNANDWPDIQARLKALLGSRKGMVKLNTIAGAYYWVAVAPVNGDADAFARKINFARVVAVHNNQRLIYLDAAQQTGRGRADAAPPASKGGPPNARIPGR